MGDKLYTPDYDWQYYPFCWLELLMNIEGLNNQIKTPKYINATNERKWEPV